VTSAGLRPDGTVLRRNRTGRDLRALKTDARPILNDGVEAHDLFKSCLPEFRRLLVKGGNAAVCCGGGGSARTKDKPHEPSYAWWSIWLAKALEFKQMVPWDKGPIGIGWHYRRSYEVVLVATKPGAKCLWYDTSGAVENIIRPGHNGIKKIIPREGDHPCAKPWELAAHFISLHTKPGDTVLDPFAGAGWVGEACRRLRRRFIGIELDPHWHAVARKRLADVKETFDSWLAPKKPAAKAVRVANTFNDQLAPKRPAANAG
jgi:DNA modification methylase